MLRTQVSSIDKWLKTVNEICSEQVCVGPSLRDELGKLEITAVEHCDVPPSSAVEHCGIPPSSAFDGYSDMDFMNVDEHLTGNGVIEIPSEIGA